MNKTDRKISYLNERNKELKRSVSSIISLRESLIMEHSKFKYELDKLYTNESILNYNHYLEQKRVYGSELHNNTISTKSYYAEVEELGNKYDNINVSKVKTYLVCKKNCENIENQLSGLYLAEKVMNDEISCNVKKLQDLECSKNKENILNDGDDIDLEIIKESLVTCMD